MKKNIGIKIFLIAIVSSLLMVIPVQAELAVEVWSVTYDSGGYDDPNGIAIDTNDNVILIGEFSGTSYTIKLDSNGNEIWSIIYPGTAAYGVISDSNDNVIVTGESWLAGNYNYFTIKYDSDGNEIWNVTYDGGGWDYGTGVVVDSGNNVIVTGAVTSGATPYARTIKYNSSGSEVWNVSCTKSTKHYTVAVDSNDNVVLLGGTDSVGYYVLKYDSNGNEVWNVTYLGQEQGIGDSGPLIAVDSNNNIIVTGIAPSGVRNYYTVKYDSSGNVIWSVTYDSGDDDDAYAVAVDSENNVIIAGGSGANYNYYTIKYDSSGNEIWNVTYDSSGEDAIQGMAVDSNNNVVVSGLAETTPSWDTHIIKYRNFNPPHGIYGWVYFLPSYSFANDTNIDCSNNTFSNSFITNKTGYYLFDDLVSGNYWINATKYGYKPNYALVEIAEEYNEVLADNCDAISNNGNWESNGTVTADTTNKKEGVASINVTTDSLYTFRKNFTASVDASSISKSTGFLAFWYYVDNSTRLGDYSTITIGNGIYKSSNNISWIISNSNYGNGWGEIFLPLNEGVEAGTLDMSAISWFDMNVNVTDDVTHKIDHLRFVEFPYTLHNIYLDPEDEGGVGVAFPAPHLVRFFVQDIYGNPKQDVEVTTTCVQTTMGSWDWLYSIFGFKTEIQLENTTMTGTTDSAGGISFLMVETIKYNLHFYNATQSIDENLTIYPKSERYTVIVGRTGFFDVEPQLFGDEINWNFTMERIDETDAWLNFSYNDTLGQTTSGSYYVYMVNETTGDKTTGIAGLEKINTSNVTYFCSTPVNIDSSVWSYNCTVHDYRGNTYILAFNATHTTAGEFKEAVSVFFRYNHPLIQFEGWEDTGYYQFLSICLLIFFGMLFTGVTLKIGSILLPLAGWILFGIGWFSPTDNLVTGAILLGIATAVGAGVFMTTSGREKNLAS